MRFKLNYYFDFYMPKIENVLKSGNTVCCINGDELFCSYDVKHYRQAALIRYGV